jgi:hypothetical protein
MVTNQLIAGDCRMLCGEHCSYEIRCLVSHLWVMAGRRLAVGCQQIVPGVFPNGVVTDRVPFRVVGQSLIRRYCQRRPPTHKRDMTQVEYRSPQR